jgi:hypothetical protein
MKMKRLFFLIVYALILIFTSCTKEVYDVDGFGNISHKEVPTDFGWILIIFVVVSVIIAILYHTTGWKEANEKANEKLKAKKLKEYGVTSLSVIQDIGKYVGGHPKRNDMIEYCSWYKKEDELIFLQKKDKYELYPSLAMRITISTIKDIVLEDASTMDRRITLGRVLLIGIFALAWRKNKKNEMAFVVIEWNDGKFNHSTTFAYEGKDAMQRANTDRNRLINTVNPI